LSFVYFFRLADGSMYVGHTDNLQMRLDAHRAGTASNDTARKRPVEMTYAEEYTTEGAAIRREKQLKRWSRRKKEALIRGDFALLKRS
jgi:predicted GIY-YIG superfamily endonuclease